MELRMFTRSEVAGLLGTTEYTIDLMRDTGILSPIKIGKAYMYSCFEIEKFERLYCGQYLSNKQEMLTAKAKVERAG